MKKTPTLRPLWRRWILCLLPLALAALLYWLLPYFPAFTEKVFTRGVFRLVGFPLEWLVSVLPFSLTELMVVAAVPSLLTLLGIWLWRMFRHPNKKRTLERGCRFLAWCVSIAALLFMVMDGAHFSRVPLGKLMELPNREYTAQELYTLCVDLADRASAAREGLSEDEKGCMSLSQPMTATLQQSKIGYTALRERYPFLVTGVWRVKGVALSYWWSYTGYTGLYCPWLGEANVNTDIPASDIGHTAAHELAHTMGFAKENECNFLGYLACVESGVPEYVYSGYLDAYIYCANALYAHNQAMWQEVYSHCSPGMRRDLSQRNAYLKHFAGPVKESAQKVNDTFIKVNGVDSGRLSYNQMVALMLRYYDKMGWLA